MNLHPVHPVFNPHRHTCDVKTAFTHFIRKIGYIYDGENRSCPTSVGTEADAIADWKQKDKA